MAVTGARGGGAPEPPADVSALDEVQVVPIVAARPHQDAEEVQVVAEVLHQRRPGAVDGEDKEAPPSDDGETGRGSTSVWEKGVCRHTCQSESRVYIIQN